MIKKNKRSQNRVQLENNKKRYIAKLANQGNRVTLPNS
jgi:hypothetical protein